MPVALSEVSVRFGSRLVLDQVSCRARPGLLVAVMGPSGAGKSTVLGLLGGRIRPDAGVRDHGGGNEPSVAWITQATVLLRRRTVRDNVALAALGRSGSQAEARRVADDCLARFGVESLAGTQARRLSGGEQQRVAVARALAARPDLLLADEPTASLDRVNCVHLVDALVDVARSGVAVVMATHDPEAAARADVTWAMVDGHIVESGRSGVDPGVVER